MRKGIVAVGAGILLISLCAVVVWIGLAKDTLYDQKQIANETFKMRFSAFKEMGVLPPGVYFVFQTAPARTEEWRNVMTIKGDEPAPLRPRMLSFVRPEIGYGFIRSFYAVTTDAGMSWTIWDGEKHIPVEYNKHHNLSPYIEDVEIQPDGTGKMRMYKFFGERDRGPDLVTEDYGRNWHLNQRSANSRHEEEVTILRPVPAALTEETHPTVEALETKIKGTAGTPFEFKRAQFVSENHGWAMTEGSLYRTTDGGKVWERLPQVPGQDVSFSAFFFVNESHGWLTAVKRIFTERYGLGNSSVIMVTDDGGKSWKLQASFPNEVVISEIRFLNANEGIAVGAQVIDSRPPYDELLLLSTSNGGKEWNNTSEPAKSALKNEYGIANDSGKHVVWRSSSSVLLLTRYGKVISTTDGGKAWKVVANFKDERPNGVISSTGYHTLALDAEQIRVVAGGMGDEGYWGDFVVQEDDRWTSYEIRLTPILDALFLSNKEVLACGSNHRPADEKPNDRLKDAGVILRSFDSGKSWQSIYRSKSYETFFFLTKVSDNDFYAVSDIGTFLRFRLPQ